MADNGISGEFTTVLRTIYIGHNAGHIDVWTKLWDDEIGFYNVMLLAVFQTAAPIY